MPYMTAAELAASIKQNEIFPVYFLYGKETYLSAGYLDRLLNKVLPKGTEQFNLQKFDGGDPDMTDLQIALEGLPMMAERKCVLFSNPNIEKMQKEAFEELLALVKDPNPASVFIIYVSSFDLNPKKMSRVKRLGEAVSKVGSVVDFAPLVQGELTRFVKSRCAKSEVTIESPAVSVLIQRCGTGLSTLAAETDKLIAYKGSGEITKADIEAVTHKSLEASVFDLSKQMLFKNASRSFAILEDLFALREEPLAILGALNGAFLDLYRAKAALLSSKKEQDVLALYPSYRGKEFRIRNAFRDAGKTDIAVLRKCLSILSAADLQLKSQRCDGQTVTEQVVVSLLAQLSGGGGR